MYESQTRKRKSDRSVSVFGVWEILIDIFNFFGLHLQMSELTSFVLHERKHSNMGKQPLYFILRHITLD